MTNEAAQRRPEAKGGASCTVSTARTSRGRSENALSGKPPAPPERHPALALRKGFMDCAGIPKLNAPYRLAASRLGR